MTTSLHPPIFVHLAMQNVLAHLALAVSCNAILPTSSAPHCLPRWDVAAVSLVQTLSLQQCHQSSYWITLQCSSFCSICIWCLPPHFTLCTFSLSSSFVSECVVSSHCVPLADNLSAEPVSLLFSRELGTGCSFLFHTVSHWVKVEKLHSSTCTRWSVSALSRKIILES